MATIVKFYIDQEGDVLAVFPQLKYNKHLYGNDMVTCYAHCGQHSALHIDYLTGLKAASFEESNPLLLELINIGYDCKITKK